MFRGTYLDFKDKADALNVKYHRLEKRFVQSMLRYSVTYLDKYISLRTQNRLQREATMVGPAVLGQQLTGQQFGANVDQQYGQPAAPEAATTAA